MKRRILSQKVCSDKDYEKLAIINELLGGDETMKDNIFDKLKGWQWLVLGIVGGLVLQNFLARPQINPTAMPSGAYSVPQGNAPTVYNIRND